MLGVDIRFGYFGQYYITPIKRMSHESIQIHAGGQVTSNDLILTNTVRFLFVSFENNIVIE